MIVHWGVSIIAPNLTNYVAVRKWRNTLEPERTVDQVARGRMLSIDVAGDPELNQLTSESELLYLRTIPHLDRDGLITGHPILLWALAAPLRVGLMDKAKVLIDEWVQQGLVIQYEGPDTPVLFFRGFRRHQANMPYGKESPSKFPPPPGWSRCEAGLVPDDEEHRFRLADQFDKRSIYRKALLAASGVGRDEVATYSRRGQAEDQDQVEVQDQDQVQAEVQAHAFDDDDVTGLSDPPLDLVKEKESRLARAHVRLSEDRPGLTLEQVEVALERESALEAWCAMMINTLWGEGGWDDAGHYLACLPDDRLERLARWLWKCHWRDKWFNDPDDPIGVGFVRHVVKEGQNAGLPPGQLVLMETDIASFADPAALFVENPAHADNQHHSIDY